MIKPNNMKQHQKIEIMNKAFRVTASCRTPRQMVIAKRFFELAQKQIIFAPIPKTEWQQIVTDFCVGLFITVAALLLFVLSLL